MTSNSAFCVHKPAASFLLRKTCPITYIILSGPLLLQYPDESLLPLSPAKSDYNTRTSQVLEQNDLDIP